MIITVSNKYQKIYNKQTNTINEINTIIAI